MTTWKIRKLSLFGRTMQRDHADMLPHDVDDPLDVHEPLEFEPPFNMGRIAVVSGIAFGLSSYEAAAGAIGCSGDRTVELTAAVVGGSIVGIVALYLSFAVARLIRHP